jgi:hypothetical protein
MSRGGEVELRGQVTVMARWEENAVVREASGARRQWLSVVQLLLPNSADLSVSCLFLMCFHGRRRVGWDVCMAKLAAF